MEPEATIPEIETELCSELRRILALDDDAAVTPETPLHTLGVDSLRLVEIMVFVEKRFGVKLIEARLSRHAFHSVSALARSVADRG